PVGYGVFQASRSWSAIRRAVRSGTSLRLVAGATLGVITFSSRAFAQPADPPEPPAAADPPPAPEEKPSPDAGDGETPEVERDEPAGPSGGEAPLTSVAASESPARARAKPPPPPPPSDAVSGKDFRSRFVLESARAPFLRPDP